MLAYHIVLVESLIATIPIVLMFEYERGRTEVTFKERVVVLFAATVVTYLLVYLLAHNRLQLWNEPPFQSPIHTA